MSEKKARIGLKKFGLNLVTSNTSTEYIVDDERIELTFIQELEETADTTSITVYADDAKYYDGKIKNGSTFSITFVNITNEILEKLGYLTLIDEKNGGYGRVSNFPQRTYLASFVSTILETGHSVIQKVPCFTVTSITRGTVKTKGEGADIQTVTLEGYATYRAIGDVDFIEYEMSTSDVTTLLTDHSGIMVYP